MGSFWIAVVALAVAVVVPWFIYRRQAQDQVKLEYWRSSAAQLRIASNMLAEVKDDFTPGTFRLLMDSEMISIDPKKKFDRIRQELEPALSRDKDLSALIELTRSYWAYYLVTALRDETSFMNVIDQFRYATEGKTREESAKAYDSVYKFIRSTVDKGVSQRIAHNNLMEHISLLQAAINRRLDSD